MMNADEIRAAIDAALFYSNGEMTTQDIMDGIADGDYRLFEFEKSWVVVCLVPYDRKLALRVAIASGSLVDQEEVMPLLDELAISLDCDFIEVYGRRGWARQLSRFGYAERYVVVTKQVGKSV